MFAGYLISRASLCGLIAMIIVSRHSDKTGERVYHAAIPFFMGFWGVAVASIFPNNLYAVFLAVLLMYVATIGALATFWTFPWAYITGAAAAIGIPLVNMGGQVGSFVGPHMLGYIRDLTRNFQSAYVILAIFFLVGTALMLSMKRYERKKPDNTPMEMHYPTARIPSFLNSL
jgi:ACS family tartrate transporter-like MFS transporter